MTLYATADAGPARAVRSLADRLLDVFTAMLRDGTTRDGPHRHRRVASAG